MGTAHVCITYILWNICCSSQCRKCVKRKRWKSFSYYIPLGRFLVFPPWEADFWGEQISKAVLGLRASCSSLSVSLWNGGRGVGEWISPVLKHKAQPEFFILKEGKTYRPTLYLGPGTTYTQSTTSNWVQKRKYFISLKGTSGLLITSTMWKNSTLFHLQPCDSPREGVHIRLCSQEGWWTDSLIQREPSTTFRFLSGAGLIA